MAGATSAQGTDGAAPMRARQRAVTAAARRVLGAARPGSGVAENNGRNRTVQGHSAGVWRRCLDGRRSGLGGARLPTVNVTCARTRQRCVARDRPVPRTASVGSLAVVFNLSLKARFVVRPCGDPGSRRRRYNLSLMPEVRAQVRGAESVTLSVTRTRTSPGKRGHQQSRLMAA